MAFRLGDDGAEHSPDTTTVVRWRSQSRHLEFTLYANACYEYSINWCV